MRKGFPLVVVIVALLATLTPRASGQFTNGAAQQNSNALTLVGAWSIDVTPTLVPAFVSLGTFSADGTLSNISSSSLIFPPESPGYGEWVRVGNGRYAITFHTLVGDGAGNLGGRQKVRATMTLGPGGDTLTGVFQVDVFDALGGFIVSDTGTVQGRRLKVEPLLP